MVKGKVNANFQGNRCKKYLHDQGTTRRLLHRMETETESTWTLLLLSESRNRDSVPSVRNEKVKAVSREEITRNPLYNQAVKEHNQATMTTQTTSQTVTNAAPNQTGGDSLPDSKTFPGLTPGANVPSECAGLEQSATKAIADSNAAFEGWQIDGDYYTRKGDGVWIVSEGTQVAAAWGWCMSGNIDRKSAAAMAYRIPRPKQPEMTVKPCPSVEESIEFLKESMCTGWKERAQNMIRMFAGSCYDPEARAELAKLKEQLDELQNANNELSRKLFERNKELESVTLEKAKWAEECAHLRNTLEAITLDRDSYKAQATDLQRELQALRDAANPKPEMVPFSVERFNAMTDEEKKTVRYRNGKRPVYVAVAGCKLNNAQQVLSICDQGRFLWHYDNCGYNLAGQPVPYDLMLPAKPTTKTLWLEVNVTDDSGWYETSAACEDKKHLGETSRGRVVVSVEIPSV